MEEKDIIASLKKPESRNFGFNQLVRSYQQRIYWLVRKMVIDHDDADDLVQEIFVKVWLSIDKFREESKLYTWIYRIATNECLNFLRKKRRRFFIPIHDIENELEAKLNNNLTPDVEDIEMKLQKALLKLPDMQRLVFNLKYYDDLTYQEIAEITNTSVGGLKANYHHAVKKVEKSLQQD